MKSIGQKIKQLEGLLGTGDAGAWALQFIQSIVDQTNHGAQTSHLSEKQVDKIEQLYDDHFA